MNILLVDDEPTLRKMIKVMLRGRGHQVLDAGSGAEAVAIANGNAIDLLIADVVMDDMDGPSLARRLTRDNHALPVLFISGYPPPDCGAEFVRCGFLTKPFSASTLNAAIAELLREPNA